MAIAVVSHPQECPKGTFPSPLKTHRKPNPNTSRPRSDSRNRNTSENEPVVKSPVPNLVMGQVKILKRGEELKSPITFPTQAPTPKSEQKTAPSPKFEQKTKTKKAVVFKPKKQDEETKKKASITPMKQDEETKLFTTDRFGPEPDKVPKKTHLTENFAGSVFVTSPSPSDLPFPAFFNKKKSVNIDATNGLLRLLRLDLVQA